MKKHKNYFLWDYTNIGGNITQVRLLCCVPVYRRIGNNHWLMGLQWQSES